MMKIALDAKKAFNNTAGLGQYSRTLINGFLKKFPSNNYHLFTPKIKSSLQKEISGDYTLQLPNSILAKAFPPYWKGYGMSKILAESRFDIIHGLSNELPFSIHKNKTIKKVVTIHDVIFLKHKEQYKPIDRALYNYRTAYAVKHADAIIAISEETKGDLQKYYNVPEHKLHVIYQSCNSSFYKEVSLEKKASVKQKYSLPEKFLLNVSSFYPRKNHRNIIEAIEILKERTDIKLILVGDQGSEKEKIKELIKEKNLAERVSLLSNVTNEDMPALYQQASAFIYPSFFEGFGIPILESLYSRIPVIATKGGCFEEVGGKYSTYVNPNNVNEISEAILKLLTDEQYKNNSIEKGILHANTMHEDIFINKTMELYSTL